MAMQSIQLNWKANAEKEPSFFDVLIFEDSNASLVKCDTCTSYIIYILFDKVVYIIASYHSFNQI